jgi:acyl-CoA synthetase (AMP-forming)/AMP-acid ligase II
MIFEQFRETAYRYRDRLAIIDGQERITYGGLLDRAAAVRAWLEAELHPGPGDIVAVSLHNSWQFVACFFATCELGAIFVPCNPQWREPELRWIAGRLGVRGAITEAPLRQEWDRVGDALPADRILTLERVAEAARPSAAELPRSPSRQSDEAPAVYLVTSGSSGVPKVVPRSHRNLAATVRHVGGALGTGPGQRFLSVVPLFHSNGFHNCLLVPLMSGGSVVIMRQFNPGPCAELIAREQVHALIAVPFVFAMLADRVADPRLLASLRLCVSNSARLPAGIARRWQERIGVRIRQSYGSTETSMVSFDGAGEPRADQPGTFVGAPIPGVDVRIVADDGQGCPDRQVGEILVRSPAMMSGYVAAPDRNREAFRDGFFRTGDLGYIGPDGGLYLTGSLRRGINVAGIKVDPVEIEQVVEALAGVTECRVDAVPSQVLGDVIRARIAVRHDARITRADVIEHCRQRLAEYKLPRVIELLESLPVTASGKVGQAWNAETLSGPP